MMNNFLRQEKPSDGLLHYKPMFTNIAVPVRVRMLMGTHEHIAALVNGAPSFPIRMPLAANTDGEFPLHAMSQQETLYMAFVRPNPFRNGRQGAPISGQLQN